jgi:methionyl aminopeptidase
MAIKIKTPEQIEGIRKSSHLAAKVLKHLEQFVVAGNTTKYINDKALEFITDHGAKSATLGYKAHGSPAFSGAICTSPNEVICHGVPNDYVLKDGDILNIDVTTILNGYFGDTCKMYTVGKVSISAQNLIDVTRECLSIGVKQCKPGNRFGNIGYEIQRFAESKGYGVVWQFCGHGVGIKFHEEPEVSHVGQKNTGKRMKPGMIFTIEPMINEGVAECIVDRGDGWTARTRDYKLSAQFEHTILITEDGCECLTDVYGEY